MIEIVIEADELPWMTTDGVHFSEDVGKIRLQHVESDMSVGIRHNLSMKE